MQLNLLNMLGYAHAFVDLFFPRLCNGCGFHLLRHEAIVCQRCLFRLPKTHFHDMTGNPVEQLFYGRYQPAAVTSFLYFTKSGMVQQLLHGLKYNGSKEVGLYLGKRFGQELAVSVRFSAVDAIVPVPLHWKKQRLRGYNQSACIAQGLSESMNVPLRQDLLQRAMATTTQTKKGRLDRWENVSEAFVAGNDRLPGRKLLLIDDVLTTGATLEACARVLEQVSGQPVYLATLACAVR